MRIAIYGRNFSENFNDAIYKIFEKLNKNKTYIAVYAPFYEFITEQLFYEPKINTLFTDHYELNNNYDIIFSIGGDGTFLECVSLVRNKEIPILGINSGRLGFLAYISKEEISVALKAIIEQHYSIEQRTLIQVSTSNNCFGDLNFALNELTVHKQDSGSMITVDVFLNEEYLNTYWADGLIIATPTGSTAYSLSAGGPIVMPGTGNFIITPIAPHNLTVRPIIVSDSNIIKLQVSCRSAKFLATLDYRSISVEPNFELIITSAEFKINMVKIENHSFSNTLRNKLMWGVDRRN